MKFIHERELNHVFDEILKVIKLCPGDLLDHNDKDLRLNAIKDGNS